MLNINKKFVVWFSRFSIFLIYFWFGILKVFAVSPASSLVKALLMRTMPFMDFGTFMICFGIFEMVIGISFLFPRLNRLAFSLLVLHMGMIISPLVLLPQVSWQSLLVPTIEGQYIIKNILTMALALNIFNYREDRN